MTISILRTVAAAAALVAVAQAAATKASALPTVDLGYEIQRATYLNSTGGFYNFSNIRYAAPPTGQFRFAAPQPPATNRGSVQTGLPDRICPQAFPAWLEIAEALVSLTSSYEVVTKLW